MIKNNKIARKKQEARGKNLWNSECHHACMIGRVVTKVNEVKQEISGFEGSEGIKKRDHHPKMWPHIIPWIDNTIPVC